MTSIVNIKALKEIVIALEYATLHTVLLHTPQVLVKFEAYDRGHASVTPTVFNMFLKYKTLQAETNRLNIDSKFVLYYQTMVHGAFLELSIYMILTLI